LTLIILHFADPAERDNPKDLLQRMNQDQRIPLSVGLDSSVGIFYFLQKIDAKVIFSSAFAAKACI
jgi:hypothetical protein